MMVYRKLAHGGMAKENDKTERHLSKSIFQTLKLDQPYNYLNDISKDPNFLYNLAECCMNQGQFDDAERVLKFIISSLKPKEKTDTKEKEIFTNACILLVYVLCISEPQATYKNCLQILESARVYSENLNGSIQLKFLIQLAKTHAKFGKTCFSQKLFIECEKLVKTFQNSLEVGTVYDFYVGYAHFLADKFNYDTTKLSKALKLLNKGSDLIYKEKTRLQEFHTTMTRAKIHFEEKNINTH
eukprot:UN24417